MIQKNNYYKHKLLIYKNKSLNCNKINNNKLKFLNKKLQNWKNK